MKSRSPDRSLFCHLVSAIKKLARCDRVYVFVKAERPRVRVSHCFANFASVALSLGCMRSVPDVARHEHELDISVTLPV